MQIRPVQLTDVTYNAAEQAFDALVSVYDDNAVKKYACSIEAPITMSYAEAAEGLKVQALRCHQQQKGMVSEVSRHMPTPRAGREPVNAFRWLNAIMSPGQRAA